jgi:ubiquinone/menaquinone biosynthesis C-methylase UbiE
MLKEIGHFMKIGKVVSKLQKQYPRAEFADRMAVQSDESGFDAVRRELIGDLEGRVLEVGCGTGAMFPYYSPKAKVEGIEPEEDFLGLALAKAEGTRGRIHAQRGDGMQLDFPDGTFDAVVFGMVLCSVPSVEQVLAEAYRVLKPGGVLRALEHVRSEAAVAGFLMDLANPMWMRLNKQGCRWNRNPLAAIESSGFIVDDVEAWKRFDLFMPAFQMRRVRAHKAGG